MRVTNAMMTNTTLININRNMRYLDKLIQQIESTKKIQTPSDDPIIASRALKFRTNIAETTQFQRNVESGLAWMNVTDAAFSNIVERVMAQIRERCVEGATGTEQASPDKTAIVTELRELIDQIGLEMNQTYAGRYVFSGFRTNEPPVLIENNNKAYEITQHFTLKDIEKTKSYQKIDPVGEPEMHDINILKLAYSDMTGVSIKYTDANGNPATITPVVKSVNDITANGANGAYNPGVNEVYYIKETGELVLGKNIAANFASGGWDVTYEKSGFKKGELNPVVYFPCTELLTELQPVDIPAAISYASSELFESQAMHDLLIQLSTGNTDVQNFDFVINGQPTTLQFDLGANMQQYYAANYGGGSFDTFVAGMYEIDYSITPENQAVFLDVLQGAYDIGFGNGSNLSPPLNSAHPTVQLDGAGNIVIDIALESGVVVSSASVNCLSALSTSYGHGFLHSGFTADTSGTRTVTVMEPATTRGMTYTMTDVNGDDNQNIQYEFATNTYVTINSLSKNVYTDKMYADLKRLCDFAESLSVSDRKDLEKYYSDQGLTGDDLKNAVDKQIADETSMLQSALYDRFNNMLYLVDRHADNCMKEQTQLGSRGKRLEMLRTRLEQDEDTYTQLLSDNEDTNLVKAIILRSAAEAAYQASLKAGASIVQLTLANFIG